MERGFADKVDNGESPLFLEGRYMLSRLYHSS